MTYQDPKLPGLGLGQNPPRYRDLDTDSYSMGSFIALVVGIVLIGVIFYAISEPLGTTASNPPPATTGQGGAQITPPVAPRMAPAAPSTTLPPIDQNVPAEKVAPPIPAEPHTNN
jgi:hypothetical protein